MDRPRVLVVEDDGDLRDLLVETLTRWGYHVTSAGNGTEALTLLERRFLRQEVGSLRARLGRELAERELVGTSPQMLEVKQTIASVANSDSPVLIEGESGTGKELVAAAIHGQSPRATGPFVPVNCGAIPAELMESEFFGHVRGAFSGAVADALGLVRAAQGGTLFLDEAAELPTALQAKLLRVLQEKEVRPVGSAKTHAVDVRIIAATNRDLEAAVASGRFRQDLYYRINVVRIVVPPLRARKDEIPALVTHFLRRFNARFHRSVTGLAPAAKAALMAYDFPGNVRQLENLIERRSEEHTSELQSPCNLVCRLLLEKKKK